MENTKEDKKRKQALFSLSFIIDKYQRILYLKYFGNYNYSIKFRSDDPISHVQYGKQLRFYMLSKFRTFDSSSSFTFNALAVRPVLAKTSF